jgi:transposase-like protein
MRDAERVQRTSLSCRFHPAVCALVFEIQHRLPHPAEMMQERSFDVHHTTIYRWIQTYAPQLEKLIRWYQGHTGCSWRVDETYIKVCGQWLYLFRAIDSRGRTIDFYLL